MKLRPQGPSALLLILLTLSSPAWAAAYGENMHIQEYIVGLAALVLVVWDIARRYMPRAADARQPTAAPSVSGPVEKLRDLSVWIRIREVTLDHPFEASLLVCAFALLNFARVPFSLSAVLVGTITYVSLVLGARLASQPAGRPAAAAKPAAPAQPAAQPAIVARPAPQPAVAARPAPRRPAPAAKPEPEKPAAAPAVAEPAAPVPAEPAAAKAEAPAPASRRRTNGTGASPSRPSRRRTPAKPKT
jgi:hypothetical protein